MLAEVSPKGMFGADGFAFGGKVFAMVTKHGEMVFKFDDDALAARMREDCGGMPWSPRKGAKFGNWLEMPVAMTAESEQVLEWAALAHGSL